MVNSAAAIVCVVMFAAAMLAGTNAEARSCYYEGGSIEVLVCMP